MGTEEQHGQMDALTALLTRRSVRAFLEDPVSEETVVMLLRAAMQAPSAGDARPWDFVVIRSKEVLQGIGDVNPYAKFAAHASVGILVCGNLERERFPGLWIQDTSAAMENLLIAAHALGLGAVWTAVAPFDERIDVVRALCSLPKTVIPLGCALVGYPRYLPKPQDRFDASRIHQDHWEDPRLSGGPLN